MENKALVRDSYIPIDLRNIADRILEDEDSYRVLGNNSKRRYLIYNGTAYSINFNHKDLPRLLVLSLINKKIDERIIKVIDKNVGIPEDLWTKLNRENRKRRKRRGRGKSE